MRRQFARVQTALSKGRKRHVGAYLNGSFSAELFCKFSPERCRNFSSASMTFRCENCGQPYAKWQGQCTACDVWGEIKQAKGNGLLYRQENSSSYRKNKSSGASWVNSFDKDVAMSVQRMNDVDIDTLARRIRLPDKELVRVYLTACTCYLLH
jgi:hypothetical protein